MGSVVYIVVSVLFTLFGTKLTEAGMTPDALEATIWSLLGLLGLGGGVAAVVSHRKKKKDN